MINIGVITDELVKKGFFNSFCILISNVLDKRSIKRTECIEHTAVFGGENLTVSTWCSDTGPLPPKCRPDDPFQTNKLFKTEGKKLNRTQVFPDVSPFGCSNVLLFGSAFFVFLFCVHVSNKCHSRLMLKWHFSPVGFRVCSLLKGWSFITDIQVNKRITWKSKLQWNRGMKPCIPTLCFGYQR